MVATVRTWILPILIVAVSLNNAIVFSQDSKLQPGNLTVLQIRITEYTIQGPIDANLSNSDLLEKIKLSIKPTPDRPLPVEPFALAKSVLRFTHVVGIESSLQVGRKVSVVVGESRDPRGVTVRNAEIEDVGTIAKLMTTPTDTGAFVAQISYESSDLEPGFAESMHPDITQLSVEGTVVLETGKTALLVGNDGRSPKVITITVD